MMPLRFGLWVLGLGAFFSVALNSEDLIGSTFFYVFQTRDLERARLLLTGHPIFYGPEMTGGGHLPGPFYYLLLTTVGARWEPAWYLLLSLNLGAALIGWWYFRTRVSVTAATIWFSMFTLSAHTRRFITVFLNVSYVFPFAVAALVFLSRAYAVDARSRTRDFAVAMLCLSLAIQLHFSLILFVLMILLLELSPKRWGLASMGRSTLIRGAIAFALPLLPYAIWVGARGLNYDFGQPAFYAGTPRQAPLSLLALLEHVGNIPRTMVLKEVFLRTVEVLPAPALALLGALALQRANPPGDRALITPDRRLLTIGMWLGLAPFSYWFFATIGLRYGIPFFLCLLFLITWTLDERLRDRKFTARYTYLSVLVITAHMVWLILGRERALNAQTSTVWLILTVLPMLALYLGRSVHVRTRPTAIALALTFFLLAIQSTSTKSAMFASGPQLLPRLNHWRVIWSTVVEHTGWSFDEAIHRIVFVNHHLEQDARPGFDSVQAGLRPNRLAVAPDGFFVAFNKPTRGMSRVSIRNWLLDQNLPDEIKSALRAGELELDEPLAPSMLIVPYRTMKTTHLPKHVHNSGMGYATGDVERRLARYPGAERVERESDNSLVFKWNDCPGQAPYCSTAAFVSWQNPVSTSITLKVRIEGAALSQVSPWISPTWTEAWIRPYVAVECAGQSHKLILAESIGYRRKYAGYPMHVLLWGNNSLVAPFERELTVPCIGEPTAIHAGREGSEIETIYRVETLPERKLTADRLKVPASED